MTTTVEPYQQYRAPREHQSALVVPPFRSLSDHLGSGSSIEFGSDLEICGKSLPSVRRLARQEARTIAEQYTRSYSDLPTELENRISAFDDSVPLLTAGHQPELFHSGVWFKNFLLHRLCHENGVGINFFVDNDLCRSTSIRVPERRPPKAHQSAQNDSPPNDIHGFNLGTTTLAFDTPRDAVPWELRQLQSRATWDSFPELLTKQLANVTTQPPVATRIWEFAEEVLTETGSLGKAIAAGRHRLELEHGIANLEAPLSSLVSTRSFARFSIQLLAELPRFQACYNEQRERYRSAHRIRNAAHPVPALEEADGWFEGPWWVYRAESPNRQRLWVRLVDDQLILSDRAGWQASIEGRLDCDNAATQWLEILDEGVLLRPRALLTTMYFRLLVSDLFIHGIGGGKYDQLTDGIVSQFFGITPPLLAVASATLHLPVSRDEFGSSTASESAQEIETQISAVKKRFWDLKHHANHFASDLGPEAQKLIATKAELLQKQPPKGQRWQWHQEMKLVNQQLSSLTEPAKQEAQVTLKQLEQRLKQAQLLESREYSFALFPESEIVDDLKSLAALG
ncbi:MAG: hypothetical protein AAGG44_19975 [Planctomycetota bacterium]